MEKYPDERLDPFPKLSEKLNCARSIYRIKDML
jgi:hypothetical protein